MMIVVTATCTRQPAFRTRRAARKVARLARGKLAFKCQECDLYHLATRHPEGRHAA